MKIKDISVRVLKKGYRIFSNKKFHNPQSDTNRQSANDKIYNLLMSVEPCMIARFGTIELKCINNYLCIHANDHKLNKIWNYIVDKTQTPWWFEEHFKSMKTNAGIFPATQETAERFSQLYLADTPSIDLLGSFQYYEKFMPLRDDVQYVHLETLYPFFVEKPWTRALKGKKVLVIHPFEETIQTQYNKREQLFNHPDVLPEFELITLKAIQSAAGIAVPHKDWFEALKHMEDQIDSIDFDICILGCGAYGLPLAAYIKRKGKKAFHIGGGLQLLFGIKGKRWDDHNYGVEEFKAYKGLMTNSYASLYNEHWIKPLEIDTPKTSNKIEEACYW
jgi:hypothetical protein